MRTFVLRRNEDISGVSGTGIVAEGIEFSDGVVALRWLVPAGNPGSGNPTSVVFHDNGMASVEKIHGHSGATEIVITGTAASVPQHILTELAASLRAQERGIGHTLRAREIEAVAEWIESWTPGSSSVDAER